MDTEIIEGNKLIAEFMGVKYSNYFDGSIGYILPKPIGVTDDLKYHCSFDWLMPVVEKIYDTCKIPEYTYGIKFFINLTIFCGIEQLWEQVVKFIKWLNNQNRLNKIT